MACHRARRRHSAYRREPARSLYQHRARFAVDPECFWLERLSSRPAYFTAITCLCRLLPAQRIGRPQVRHRAHAFRCTVGYFNGHPAPLRRQRVGVVRRYDIDRHWDRPGQRAAARPDQTRLLDKNGVHDRRLFHHDGRSGRCRFSRNSSADPIMGMADCPEFVGRSPIVGAGGVAAAVEKTRTRKSVRSETSANRGRLAFAAGMAGHTVHGAERDAFLCRRRLATDHPDGPWHIPGASKQARYTARFN